MISWVGSRLLVLISIPTDIYRRGRALKFLLWGLSSDESSHRRKRISKPTNHRAEIDDDDSSPPRPSETSSVGGNQRVRDVGRGGLAQWEKAMNAILRSGLAQNANDS